MRLRKIPLLLLVIALPAGMLVDCEQRYSGDLPLQSPAGLDTTSFSDAGLSAVLGAGQADAGGAEAVDPPIMSVARCVSPSAPCPGLAPDASIDDSYHVVFGSGRASIRSRGEATSDLYREFRDHLEAGERLDIEPRSAGAHGSIVGARPSSQSASSGDALMQSALALLEVVDAAGRIDVDIVHGAGLNHCRISLGQAARDGGAAQCLVREPDRPERSPMTRNVLSW